MATHIPHSLDAVIVAVQALVDGRPMPDEWSREPEAAPVPVEAPAPPLTTAQFDEVVLMQAISDLIDQKLKDLPQPQPVIQQPTPDPELMARVEKLEHANAVVPPGLNEAVLLVLDTQKSQTIRNDDLDQRVAALETVMLRLGAAVHKEQAA